MANYVYEEVKTTTKKLAGVYDADKHTICVDGVDHDVLDALSEFEGAEIEFVVKIKEKINLLDE